MKTIAILAVALFCSPLLLAQEPVHEVIQEMVELNSVRADILESVVDKATADAAAEKLVFYQGVADSTRAKMTELGPLDKETAEMIVQRVRAAITETAPRMNFALQRIWTNNFYGSEALKALLEG